MIFKITKSNGKQILVRAESWLDLLKGLTYDVIKIERLEQDKPESVKSVLDNMDNAVNEFFSEAEHIVNNGTMNITL